MADTVRPLLVGMEWCDDVPGGLNRYVRDLHAALTAAGANPATLVTGPMRVPVGGVRAVATMSTPLRQRLAAFAAAARSAGDADVVDAHFALTAAPVLLAKRRPYVVHFHGPWAQESRSDGRRGPALAVKFAVERLVYRRARRVIVLSEAFGRLVSERYGVPPCRVEVVRPGVDLAGFAPGPAAAARERLGLPPDAYIALSVRRLIPRVGLGDLLAAWAGSGLGDRGGVLLIAGSGPLRNALELRAETLGIAKSVRFLGRVSDADLVDCYRAADVSVVPSVELEGFGLVVLESLACGTPVIATDVGGLPEILAGLRPDLVVPAEDPIVLGARLAAAADGTRPLPGRDACRRYAEGYGWDTAVHRHQEIYAEAAARRRRRPAVVYLDHCALLSGGELALSRLLPALRDDLDAHVILGEHGPLTDRLRAGGASVEVLPMPEAARGLRRNRVGATLDGLRAAALTARYCLRLRARLRALRPDLVHTNSLKSALYGGLAARAAGVPVVWHVRDRIAADYLPAPAVWLVRRCARWFPSALIANSETTRATLGPVARRATVIPSPVDVRGGPPTPRDALTVGVVGRLAPWKGQDLFLRAFADAFPTGDARAVLVGEALFGEEDYARGLRELAGTLGLAGRVEFRGFRPDIAAELSTMDVLVHCSTLPEPFGQVVVEGMAAGLPVVVPAAGGPGEVVRSGVDGLHYPIRDQGRLAAALRRLADDPDLRRRLGTAARLTAERYTPEAVAGDVLSVYRGVLARH